MELYPIPALPSLVERVHDREAVEGVVLKVSLPHTLVRLSRQGHEIAELTELLENKILVRSLLEAHGLEDGLVGKFVCQPHKEGSSVFVLPKLLKQFSHHETEADEALRAVLLSLLAFRVHVIYAVGCLNYIFDVVLCVKSFVRNARVQLNLVAMCCVQVCLNPFEIA